MLLICLAQLFAAGDVSLLLNDVHFRHHGGVDVRYKVSVDVRQQGGVDVRHDGGVLSLLGTEHLQTGSGDERESHHRDAEGEDGSNDLPAGRADAAVAVAAQ